jgi:hypothetical protein
MGEIIVGKLDTNWCPEVKKRIDELVREDKPKLTRRDQPKVYASLWQGEIMTFMFDGITNLSMHVANSEPYRKQLKKFAETNELTLEDETTCNYNDYMKLCKKGGTSNEYLRIIDSFRDEFDKIKFYEQGGWLSDD